MTDYQTRKLTGKTSWPITLLAGMEKAGKTYAAVEASASKLVGRTFWVGIGEDIPDEYLPIAGDGLEVVEHDGTYRSILGAIEWATRQPTVDGLPNTVVVDSMGRLWALLSDAAQATADERAVRKQQQGKGRGPGPDGADVTMDLWNTAKQRWAHVLDALRGHQGPVILTARLEEVTVVENGQPTKAKTWKVVAEKNLPFDVGVIVQMRSFGETYLTGVKSLRFKPKPNELTQIDEFTMHDLWTNLGLADAPVGERAHDAAKPLGAEAERQALLAEVAAAADKAGVDRKSVSEEWASSHDGQFIGEATDLGGLELLRDDLMVRANQKGTES